MGVAVVTTVGAAATTVVAGVVALSVELGTALGSIVSTTRLATRAKAAATPAASSADVTGPRAVRLSRSVSAVVRLMASTFTPWRAVMASSNVARLPSSLPSDNNTSTLCSAVGVKCWLAATATSYRAVSPATSIESICAVTSARSVVGGVNTVTTSANVSTPMRTSAGIELTNSFAAAFAASMALSMLPDASMARMTSTSSAGTWAPATSNGTTATATATIAVRTRSLHFTASTHLRTARRGW